MSQTADSAGVLSSESPFVKLDGWLAGRFSGWALTLAALVVAAAWVPRMFRMLWVDETLTYWEVYGGWRRALRIQNFDPGQSTLHAVLTSLFYFGPGKHMEFWLRLPSMLAMLAAAYFLFRLANEWFGAKAGWIALLLFVSDKGIASQAANARPYAAATAVCLALIYGLHVWISRRRVWGWVLFVVSAILVPYFHYLFLVFGLTPIVYLALWPRRGRRLPWLSLAAASALIVAGWIPLRTQAAYLFAQRHTVSFQAVPGLNDLLASELPQELAFSALLAVVAATLLGGGFDAAGQASRRLALVVIFWGAFGPAGAVSRVPLGRAWFADRTV